MDLWFGDSWVIGSELINEKPAPRLNIARYPNAKVNRDRPDSAFPHYVSAYRNRKYINFAKGASSIEYALSQLIKFCTSSYNPEKQYTAFLCVTTQNRGYGFSFTTGKEHHYCNGLFKSEQDLCIYDSIVALNSFYAVCKMHNIECFIVPVFCDVLIPTKHVLFLDSLITLTNLVKETYNIDFIETAMYNPYIEENATEPDHPCSKVAQLNWIKPNYNHPNIQGHKDLAKTLIKLLSEKSLDK